MLRTGFLGLFAGSLGLRGTGALSLRSVAGLYLLGLLPLSLNWYCRGGILGLACNPSGFLSPGLDHGCFTDSRFYFLLPALSSSFHKLLPNSHLGDTIFALRKGDWSTAQSITVSSVFEDTDHRKDSSGTIISSQGMSVWGGVEICRIQIQNPCR